MAILSSKLNIPVIDFSGFRQGSPAEQNQVVQAIYRACHEIGFMYLKNHGIPNAVLDSTFAQARHFFDLPVEVKEQVYWEPTNRGYVPIERQKLDAERPGDYKEAFDLGSDLNPYSPNKWPVGESEFCQQMTTFSEACEALASDVLRCFARALKVPEFFFVEYHNQKKYTLRLLHYPALEVALKPNQVRAGDHTDWGSITLLFQDDVGGLEVRTRQGEWISAPSLPNTVLVNIGDLMQRWTNHEFCSTPHRVVIPTSSQGSRSRYSIAFFYGPNHTAQIECLESCCGPNRPPLYEPISAHDYFRERVAATYGVSAQFKQ